ncbi:MAG: hypothetical protein HY645_04465 [Acidobacteria bacterium]|nr:hypothetical protein [Acidobacteriota bacterium]
MAHISFGSMGWTALLVHIGAFLLALFRVEPVYTHFYSIAWWTYIFGVASINHRHSNSLMVDTPGQGVRVFLFSAPVWFMFELFNVRMNNWHYLDVPVELYIRWPGYFIAFGTVLPALFETERLLRNLGLFATRTGPRLRVGQPLLVRWLLLGALMLAALLLKPVFFFPALWLAFIFLLDPLVYRYDRSESLLGQAESGNYERILRLMTAGLICGLLWEFWNFWSGAKWIYSLPFFYSLKIFEMPALGFLGFLPFALECYLIYRVYDLFRTRVIKDRFWMRVLALALMSAYCVAAMLAIDRFTVLSYKVTL